MGPGSRNSSQDSNNPLREAASLTSSTLFWALGRRLGLVNPLGMRVEFWCAAAPCARTSECAHCFPCHPDLSNLRSQGSLFQRSSFLPPTCDVAGF